MDMMLFLMAGIGLSVPLVMKAIFHFSICWKEWAIQTGIVTVVLVGATALAFSSQTTDVRVLNGEITNKYQDRVSCSHSYSCNCRTTTDSKGNTSTKCDTCYEHTHDYDWVVMSSVGRFTIDRIDRQGRREPPRFTQAAIGDPVARTENWTNYVQAAPQSIFNESAVETFDGPLPTYPSTIHDYHYLDRVFVTGTAHLADYAQWNHDLAERLKTIGREVRGNVIIVVTDTANPNYATALERLWLRGKSNDTVVVLSVQNNTIAWANAFGWSTDPMLYIALRDKLEALDTVERSAVLSIVEETVLTHFKPHAEDHFAYLKNDITLPGWVMVMLGLLALALSGGTTYYFHHNETFPSTRFSRPTYRSKF